MRVSMYRNRSLDPFYLFLPCVFLLVRLDLSTAIATGQQRLGRPQLLTTVLLTPSQSPMSGPSIPTTKRWPTAATNTYPRSMTEGDTMDPLPYFGGGPRSTETTEAPPVGKSVTTVVDDANLRPLYTEFPSMSPTLSAGDAGSGSDVSSSPPTEPTEAPSIIISSTAPVVFPTTNTANPTMKLESESIAPVVTTAPATSSPIAVLLPLTEAPVPFVAPVSSSPIQGETYVPTSAKYSSPSELPVSTDSDEAVMDAPTKSSPPTFPSSVSSPFCKDMDEFVFWVSTDQMARNCAWLRKQQDSMPDTKMCTSNGVPYYICQATCGSCENVNTEFKQQIEELLP